MQAVNALTTKTQHLGLLACATLRAFAGLSRLACTI